MTHSSDGVGKVQRYRLGTVYDTDESPARAVAFDDELGGFVRYKDYHVLEATNARLERKLADREGE